jgi:hypothetical protein
MILALLILAFVPKHWVTVTLPTADSCPSCASTAPWPIHSPFWYVSVYQGPDSLAAWTKAASDTIGAKAPNPNVVARWGALGIAPGGTLIIPVWPDTLGTIWYAVRCAKRADTLGTAGPESCPFRAVRVR